MQHTKDDSAKTVNGNGQKVETMDIVTIHSPAPSISLREIIEQAKGMAGALVEMKRIALSVTNREDWENMGGKPYLTATGSEKVARLFKVAIEGTKWVYEEYEDFAGQYYEYTFTGIASMPSGDRIDCIGVCDSRDKFFATANGEQKEQHEVSRRDIKKKAYTNMFNNGVTRLLGLRNLNWDEVLAGLAMRPEGDSGDPFEAVNFDSREKRQQAAASGNLSPDQMLAEIRDMINTMADTPAGRTKLSRELLGFENAQKEWVNGPNDPMKLKSWKNYPKGVDQKYQKVLQRFNETTDQKLADGQN